jgi:hypothetical protein
MMPTTAIEEEYWSLQYKTTVSGEGRAFWPPDGEWKYSTPEAAAVAARELISQGRHEELRVLHITRRVEYGDPITQPYDSDPGCQPGCLVDHNVKGRPV